MKRTIALFLCLVLFSPVVFASTGLKYNGADSGAVTDINIKNADTQSTAFFDGSMLALPILDPSLFAVGTGQGGSVSAVSSTVAVSVTAAIVRKVLDTDGNALFTAGTMANGQPGQILTIFAVGGSPGGGTTGNNYTITPTTKTGFTSVKLSATKDSVTFLYVNDTVGWIILSYAGTITITF